MCQVRPPSGETVTYNNHDASQDYVLYLVIIARRIAEIEVNKCFDWLVGSLFENFCCFMCSG